MKVLLKHCRRMLPNASLTLLVLSARDYYVPKLIKNVFTFLSSCNKSLTNESDPQVLFTSYCSGCHVTPNPSNIPKNIWEENVLPEMAARSGYLYDGFNPKKNKSNFEFSF